MTGKKNASRAGYDQEEAYFYKREQELIEKMRSGRPKLELVSGSVDGKSRPVDPTQALENTKKPKAA
jgi:hypothetical protein